MNMERGYMLVCYFLLHFLPPSLRRKQGSLCKLLKAVHLCFLPRYATWPLTPFPTRQYRWKVIYLSFYPREDRRFQNIKQRSIAFQWWINNSPCVPRKRDYRSPWLSSSFLPTCFLFLFSLCLLSFFQLQFPQGCHEKRIFQIELHKVLLSWSIGELYAKNI